nr:hypothetical protein [Tanacetum cinerariifolium]
MLEHIKVVGQILLDRPLSYALTATADVPAVYLQQFWRTMSKVPDTKDTIKLLLDTQQFTYTMDMFQDTLHLPVETPDTSFVAPANIHTIEAFMNIVVYQAEIRETNDFKEYETVVSTHITYRITPRAPRSPTVSSNEEKDDVDFEDRLETGSHKENPKFVDDDDDKEREKKDDEKGSLEIRNEETQTTISTTLRSPRKLLSSDKKNFQELTDTISIPTTTTSKHPHVKKRFSSKYSHLPGALHRMCRRQGITKNSVNDLIENNLNPCIVATIIEDRDAFRSAIPAFVSQEFKTHAPKIITELFKEYSHHDEHQDDDAPPEGEKREDGGWRRCGYEGWLKASWVWVAGSGVDDVGGQRCWLGGWLEVMTWLVAGGDGVVGGWWGRLMVVMCDVPETQNTAATIRYKTYDELTDAEKLHESCDMKATNIVLQGLP